MPLGVAITAINTYNTTVGNYYDSFIGRVIILFPRNYSFNDNIHVAAHELGHHIWNTKLTEVQREQYIEVYHDANHWVSSYAKTNVKEDFAEEIEYATICIIDFNKIYNDRNIWVMSE